MLSLVDKQTISKWELGESNPDYDKIVSLCEIFNISTEELLRNKKLKSDLVLKIKTTSGDISIN